MADYRLTDTDKFVVRTKADPHNPNAGEAWIPNDPLNMDWVEYQEWLAEGNVPDPYVEPPPPPPTEGEAVAFDHENRIRSLEGEPPMPLPDFMKRVARKPIKLF